MLFSVLKEHSLNNSLKTFQGKYVLVPIDKSPLMLLSLVGDLMLKLWLKY